MGEQRRGIEAGEQRRRNRDGDDGGDGRHGTTLQTETPRHGGGRRRTIERWLATTAVVRRGRPWPAADGYASTEIRATSDRAWLVSPYSRTRQPRRARRRTPKTAPVPPRLCVSLFRIVACSP